MKEATDGNVIIDADENTLRVRLDKGFSVDFEVDNSTASLPVFEKQNYSTGKNTADNRVDIMGSCTTKNHSNIISGSMSEKLCTFNLTEPADCKITFATTREITDFF